MSKKKKSGNNDKILKIMNQFENNMRTDIKQGRLSISKLEKHLTDVKEQMSDELQNVTKKLLVEAKAEEEKKTSLAHTVDEKQE